MDNKIKEKNGYSILVVDDDQLILKSLKRALNNEGYEVVTTDDPKEVVTFLKDREFSVIISDFKMPDISGIELLKYIKKRSPKTIHILLTGESSTSEIPDLIASETFHCHKFLTKPWDDAVIQGIIQECIAQFGASRDELLDTV